MKSDLTDIKTKRRHNDLHLEYVNERMVANGYSRGTRVLAAAVVRKFYARRDSALFGDFFYRLAESEETANERGP